nr:hypothetical protein [Mycobacterium heckeshornense]
MTAGQRAAIACEALPLLEEEGRRKMARAAAEEQRRRAALRNTENKLSQGVADLPHPDNREKPKQRAPRSRDIAARSASAKRRSSSVARHIVSVRRSIISISRDRPSPATTVLSTAVAHDLLRRFLARLSGSSQRIAQGVRIAGLLW